MRTFGLTLAAAALLAAGPWAAPARADFTVYDEMYETFMEAQGNSSLFIGLNFGPDGGSILQMTASLDTTTGAFSFATLAGNSYLGEAISLSVAGVYDASTRSATWTGEGSLGSVAWTIEGSALWEGDPKGTITEKTTLGPGNVYTIKGDIDYTTEGPGKGTSKGKYTITGPPNGPGGPGPFGPFDGTDTFGGAGRWRHNIVVPKNPFTPGGAIQFSSEGPMLAAGGAAAGFTIQIVPVPEPSSLAMAGLAAAALLGVARLRARRPS